MVIKNLYNIYLQHPSIQTDTRKLQPGDLFFALKGANYNGNLFANEALRKGASYCIVDEIHGEVNENIILVADVLKTLQELAKYHRNQFNIPVIAITGSNGKTTTKELLHCVLSTQYKTYTTEGNLNNHIGIPLTILKIKSDAEIAIIEMGANHLKEIEEYCQYAQPNYGVITNCGKAHLEGFGSVEGVKKAKGELYHFLKKHHHTIFAFDDYEYLHQMLQNYDNIVWYGTKKGITTASIEKTTPFLALKVDTQYTLQTHLVGSYNLPNILCAIAIGKYFNVDITKITTAIQQYIPSNNRSQLIEKGTNKIIIDAYNANPSSMKVAIENFANITGNKILLLGAMKELGTQSIEEHQALIHLLQQYQWQKVILIGGDFAHTQHTYLYFNTPEEAKSWLAKENINHAYLLIKGSRSIAMEKILEE